MWYLRVDFRSEKGGEIQWLSSLPMMNLGKVPRERNG